MMIAGFERPSAGRLSLDSLPITGPHPDRVVFFQDANAALFPWLTVRENVSFGLQARRIPRAQHRSIIDHHLRLVGLAAHAEKFPAQLSGGMRQRLQLARGLALDPRILLMDEPFGALDALTRADLQRQLQVIWARTRKTVVFVTHDIAEAIMLGDFISVMSCGPNANIAKTIDVSFPRPRTPAAHEFGELVRDIERMLDGSKPGEAHA